MPCRQHSDTHEYTWQSNLHKIQKKAKLPPDSKVKGYHTHNEICSAATHRMDFLQQKNTHYSRRRTFSNQMDDSTIVEYNQKSPPQSSPTLKHKNPDPAVSQSFVIPWDDTTSSIQSNIPAYSQIFQLHEAQTAVWHTPTHTQTPRCLPPSRPSLSRLDRHLRGMQDTAINLHQNRFQDLSGASDQHKHTYIRKNKPKSKINI